MRFFSVIIFFVTSLLAQSPPIIDSNYVNKSEIISDTTVQSDSVGKNVDSILKVNPVILSPIKDTLSSKKINLDSTFDNGVYAGIGVGWSLGKFDAERLWERTLPSALIDLRLKDNTLVIPPDTITTESPSSKGDSSLLKFSIKDKPTSYNMTFPISISLTKYRKDDRFTGALAFSLFSKNQKSTISLDDSLNRRIDLRQKFLLYSLSLQFIYSKRISPIYFSIDGIDRSDFLLGFGITPLMRIKTTGSTKRYSDADDSRIIGIEDTIKKQLLNHDCYGFGFSFRTGISTTQRFSTRAVQIDLLYSLSWNDYFYNNGNRVYRGALNKNDPEADKALSFLSNRLEINLSLLRKSSKSKTDEIAKP